MTIVKFATLCDRCESRSPEYESWPTCRECDEYICPQCAVPGTATEDYEAHEVLCRRCDRATLPSLAEKVERLRNVARTGDAPAWGLSALALLQELAERVEELERRETR